MYVHYRVRNFPLLMLGAVMIILIGLALVLFHPEINFHTKEDWFPIIVIILHNISMTKLLIILFH